MKVTVVAALTTPAVIVNVAEVLPAAMVTLEGTCAAEGLELDRETTAPPEGAAAVNVTVPEPVWPLLTEAGAVTLASVPACGRTVIGNVELTLA